MEKTGKLYEAIQFYRKAMQIVPDIEFKLDYRPKPSLNETKTKNFQGRYFLFQRFSLFRFVKRTILEPFPTTPLPVISTATPSRDWLLWIRDNISISRKSKGTLPFACGPALAAGPFADGVNVYEDSKP